MKKPFLVTISLVFLGFTSCSLEEEGPEIIQTDLSTDTQLKAYFQSNGSEDQNMDELLFEIAETFEFDILNPSNFDTYTKLFNEYQEVHLSKILNPSQINNLESLEQGLKVREFEYYASLLIPNIDVADFALNPIIAPGVQIDYDDDDLVGDVIVGWYYAESGEKKITYLDENLGTSIKRPLFIITNDDQTEAKINKDPIHLRSAKSVMATASTFPAVDAVMIEERFERTGASDVFLGFVATDYVYGQWGGKHEEHLRDTNKDYLGVYLDAFLSLESFYRYADLLESIYMVTYERDWYTSLKDVSFPDGYYVSDLCKMVNSNEWYVKTYARYDEEGDLEYLYGSYSNILVTSSKGGIVFTWIN